MKNISIYLISVLIITSCSQQFDEIKPVDYQQVFKEHMTKNGYNFSERENSLVLKWEENMNFDHFIGVTKTYYSQHLKTDFSITNTQKNLFYANNILSGKTSIRGGTNGMSCSSDGTVCCWIEDNPEGGGTMWCFDYTVPEIYVEWEY